MSEEKLIRGIGRWDLTAIVINTIIGAGIFGLPSSVYAAIGTYSMFAFVACALIIGMIVLCYAEVASRFSSTGGSYLYAHEAFGPAVGFEVGWLYWIVRVVTPAANCNLLVTYAGFFWPAASEPSTRLVIILAVVLLLTVINVVGVRQSTLVTNIFTVGKLVPLFLFAGIGLFFLQPQNFTFESSPTYSSFSSAVLLLLYAFVGFETAVIPAGEIRDPKRAVPFALFVGLLVVASIYILVQIVSIGTLPTLATSKTPLADAATNFMGPYGAALIALGGLISIFGNLNVGLLGASRLLYAMGERKELPGSLAITHTKFRTPYVSIILNGVVVFILTVYSSFLTAVAIATITRLIVYATTCLSLPVFRRRNETSDAAYLAPFGVFVSIASIAIILWLLTNVDFRKEGIPILVAAAVGILIYALNRLLRRSGTIESSD